MTNQLLEYQSVENKTRNVLTKEVRDIQYLFICLQNINKCLVITQHVMETRTSDKPHGTSSYSVIFALMPISIPTRSAENRYV